MNCTKIDINPVVVHIIIGLNVGGAELMLSRLVLSHQSEFRRFNHVVISLTDIGPIGQRLMENGVTVYALGAKSAASSPLVFMRLVVVLLKIKPSVVQTWMYHSDLIGGLAARLVGLKYVIWNVRNTTIPQGRWSTTQFFINACARLSHYCPHMIVCCAQAARDNHVRLGYAADKMVVISNGYDLSVLRVAPWRRLKKRDQLGFGQDEIVVTTVGRFDPLKDYKNFVDAAARIAARRPFVRFLLVGGQVDATNSQLMDWISSTGYADRFLLLGERDDVADLMSASDIYCLASRSEGFPNVVAEAMAMQLPCVVTDVGDSALIVRDAGIVVPPQSPIALAAALTTVIDLSHAQRIALGTRARKIIEESYSIEAVSSQYLSLYFSVIT